MSYARVTPRRRRRALGDAFPCPTFVPAYLCNVPTTAVSSAKACVDKANASSQVASIDAQVNTLAANWKPTGYYTPAEIKSLLDVLATEAEAAGAALAAAPRSTSDAEDQIAQAFDDLTRKYKDRAYAYQDALAEAARTGAQVIDGPAVKDWVLSSMRAISDAYVVATVMSCMQTWIEKWLDRAYKAAVAIGAVAYRVVGVAVKVGQAVVKAADRAGSLAAAVIEYGPYAAVGIAAYLLFMKARR